MKGAQKPGVRKTEDHPSDDPPLGFGQIIGKVIFRKQIVKNRVEAVTLSTEKSKQVQRIHRSVTSDACIHHLDGPVLLAKYFLDDIRIIAFNRGAAPFRVGISQK